MAESSLSQRVASEGVGTALLVAAVIGSRVMGERLAGGKHRHRPAGKHDRDWNGAGCAHHHPGATLWCALQPRGKSCICSTKAHVMAGGIAVRVSTNRGRVRRGNDRASDVSSSAAILVRACSPRVSTILGRIHSDFWAGMCDRDQRQEERRNSRSCRRCLYSVCLLVRFLHILCESRGYSGALRE